jgi:hypothetical protein
MKTLVKVTFIMCIMLLSQLNSTAQNLDTIPQGDSYEVYQNLKSVGISLEKSGRNGYTGVLLQSTGVILILLPELDKVNTTPETYYVGAGMIVAGIVFQVVGHIRKAKAGKILQNISVSDSGVGIKIPIQ